MARIKAEHDVDYVIVYARSRMHRNSIAAAITKRDLRNAGAVLISVTDYTEDTPVGDLVSTVLDAVNEYQSRASGADISYKMGQKIARGGSVGRAPIGYLNVREQYEGREVRTVVIDPVRGPLVRMAFELYATGTYGFHDLIAVLTDAGLRMRPTRKYPAGNKISIAKLGQLLRCRYYLGYVNLKGVEYTGRHEPLIGQALFDRVQEVLDGQRGGGTRARVHHHYLKGTAWCHRCKRRLMIMRGKGKRGDLYFYYICRGRQDHTCDLPYLPLATIEEAVERHYTTVALPAGIRSRITKSIDRALNDDSTINEGRRTQIKAQLTNWTPKKINISTSWATQTGPRTSSPNGYAVSGTTAPASNGSSTRPSAPISTPAAPRSSPCSICSAARMSSTGSRTRTPAACSTRHSSHSSTSTRRKEETRVS
jgi:site-specific DNA recombinase